MFFTWNHQTLVRTSSDNWTKAHGLCWNYFWRKNLTVSQNEITSVCVFFTKFLHSFFVFIIFLDDESRQGKNGTTTSFWRVGSPHHWDLAGSLAWRTRRVWWRSYYWGRARSQHVSFMCKSFGVNMWRLSALSATLSQSRVSICCWNVEIYRNF